MLTAAVLIVAAGLIAVYLWMGKAAQQSGESAGPLESITLGLAMQPSDALTMIAINQGYFAAQGLDVTVKQYPSGKRALVDGLFAGEVEIATTADMPAAIAALDGQDFRIIASIFNADNVNRIVARRDAGIAAPSDLKGKRIATQRASAVHYFLHLFLLEHGIARDDVAISFMTAEELAPALAAGSIDAFAMREPYISEARALLQGNAVVFEAPGIYRQAELVVASSQLIAQRPHVLPAVLQALMSAEDYAMRNPADAMTITARYLGIGMGKIEAAWPTLQLRVALDQALLIVLESQARWAIREGVRPAGQSPNFLDHFYLDSLLQVKPQAMTIIR